MQIEFTQHLTIYGERHAISIRVDHDEGCIIVDGDEMVEPNEKLQFAISYPFDMDDECMVFDYYRCGGWTRAAFADAVRDAYRDMYRKPYSAWMGLGALFLERATRLAPGQWRLIVGS